MVNKKRAFRLEREITQDIQRIKDVDTAKEVLEKIQEKVDTQIAQQPKIRTPGAVVNGRKVPYTFEDTKRLFPIVTFTPEETIPLTWNGVRVQALANVEMHVPLCFKDIYDRHRRELSRAASSMPKDAGFETIIAIGAGALEPEK